MLVSQAHTQFKILLDKTDVLNSANFLPEEIDQYLSDAQEQFIEQRAYGNNFKRLSVEETQQRVKDLQDITINGNLNTFVNNADNVQNGTFVALPDGVTILDNAGVLLPEFRHPLTEFVTVQCRDCHGAQTVARVPVEALTHDEYNKITQNPFAAPNLDRVYRLPYGKVNNIQYYEVVIDPSFTLSIYHLRYLKNPLKFNLAQIVIPPALTPFGLSGTQQIQMTDSACREIIMLAVRNALGTIQAPAAQDAIQRLNEIS